MEIMIQFDTKQCHAPFLFRHKTKLKLFLEFEFLWFSIDITVP